MVCNQSMSHTKTDNLKDLYIYIFCSQNKNWISDFTLVNAEVLFQEVRRVIIDHYYRIREYRKISDECNMPVSTIRAIIQKWKQYGLTTNMPQIVRLHKLRERADSFKYIYIYIYIYVMFWPSTRPPKKCYSKVMHRKEVTHSNGQ